MTSPAAAGRLELPGPFRFRSTAVDGGQVRLRYDIGDTVTVEETVDFPFPLPATTAVEQAVEVLHLVAGVSYYKCIAPRPLEVPPLDDDRRALVRALYDDGLREFAVTNGIGVPLPVELVEDDGAGPANSPGKTDARAEPALTGALIPIGGGKDSALVADLVPDGTLLAVNPVGAHERLADHLGRDLVRVRRTLDPQLRDLVARGAPNGHVPVTAINSAVSVIAALALGRRDVLIGLERSASEPSVVVDGVPVNHQFSKSIEAEHLLAQVFAPLGVRYVSILRPLTELAIGAAVARRGLTDGIVSCNRAFTTWTTNEASRSQRPCGECAKCLFTSLMLAPSLDPAEVRAHFGRDLLDEPEHVEPVRDLWSDAKPFDCVGERLETAAAVTLLARQPAWRRQVVVDALAPEADAMLADAAVDPASFLDVGAVADLPPEYRDRVAALADEIARPPVSDEA